MVDSGIAEKAVPTKALSRRDFLKIVGLSLLGLGGAFGGVNRLLGWLSENDFGIEPPDQEGFVTHKDLMYPSVSWVLGNLAVASDRLGRVRIPPGKTASLIEMLGIAQDINKTDNRDPTKGFVFGFDLVPMLNRTVGNGLCKVATDVFRAAMKSPVLIEERHTHFSVEEKHPYFKDTKYPYGTDAAVYVSEGNNYDLKITNPWDFPLGISYRLWDRFGQEIDLKAIMKGEIGWAEYYRDLLYKYRQGAIQWGLPLKRVAFPDNMAEIPVSTTTSFYPVLDDKPDMSARQWQVEIKPLVDEQSGQYRWNRVLKVGGEEYQESWLSNYQ
jgi:hypothetical protein